MPDSAHEIELLRAVAARYVLGSDRGVDLAQLSGKVDWHRTLWLARQHGLLLLLRDALDRRPPPRAVLDQLESLRQVNQLRSLARAREICQLQDLFDRYDIQTISTDRWMLAYCLNRRPDQMVPGSTLHYLVHPKDLSRTAAVLTEAGHPVEADPEKLITPGHSPVKLTTGIESHHDPACFWKKSSALTLGGRQFHRLSSAHWLLLKVPRCRAPDAMTLGEVAEIVMLAHQVSPDDWFSTLIEAERVGLKDPLAACVITSYQILGLPLPSVLATLDLPKRAAIALDDEAPANRALAAPFLSTPPLIVERMLALAETGSRDLIWDLGCGDGRIAIRAATGYGARGRGIDRDPTRVAEAIAYASKQGVSDRVTFECGDLFSANISNATVITCYLLPQLQPPLLEKLHREAKPGTRIVSHEFIFPGWPPEKTEIIRTGPLKVSQIYLWRIG